MELSYAIARAARMSRMTGRQYVVVGIIESRMFEVVEV